MEVARTLEYATNKRHWRHYESSERLLLSLVTLAGEKKERNFSRRTTSRHARCSKGSKALPPQNTLLPNEVTISTLQAASIRAAAHLLSDDLRQLRSHLVDVQVTSNSGTSEDHTETPFITCCPCSATCTVDRVRRSDRSRRESPASSARST